MPVPTSVSSPTFARTVLAPVVPLVVAPRMVAELVLARIGTPTVLAPLASHSPGGTLLPVASALASRTGVPPGLVLGTDPAVVVLRLGLSAAALVVHAALPGSRAVAAVAVLLLSAVLPVGFATRALVVVLLLALGAPTELLFVSVGVARLPRVAVARLAYRSRLLGGSLSIPLLAAVFARAFVVVQIARFPSSVGRVSSSSLSVRICH